jgi:hypothetical protein
MVFWSGKLLLVLASKVILGSEFHGTQDHIFLSHDSGSRATVRMTIDEGQQQFTRPDHHRFPPKNAPDTRTHQISLCGFFLFLTTKNDLERSHFETLEEILKVTKFILNNLQETRVEEL